MSPMVKKLALAVFALSALTLVWAGSWYQGLALWLAGVFGMIVLDKRHIERRLSAILPKLYVCAKPEEYLEWLEDLGAELVFKNLFEEKLNVYRASGWLYQVGQPMLAKIPKWDGVKAEVKHRDPLKNLEKLLLSPADRQRRLLNALYLMWLTDRDGLKALKPLEIQQFVAAGEARISEADPQKPILSLIGRLILAKWQLAHQQRQEAEKAFLALRETEVFNLMFGEVNYHLAQVETQKRQKQKAAYYLAVALNFADGTALEARILTDTQETR